METRSYFEINGINWDKPRKKQRYYVNKNIHIKIAAVHNFYVDNVDNLFSQKRIPYFINISGPHSY